MLSGAIVGAILIVPAVALLYVGSELAGLPFVPFDVFDWVARRLPGSILTFGIDTMVGLIRAFDLGELSSAAKTAEQMLAVAGMVLTGIVGGAVLFGLLRPDGRHAPILAGVTLGMLLGIPIALISLAINQTATAPPAAGVVWILLVFVSWGAAAGWAYRQLAVVRAEQAAEGAAGVEVERIDRRRFLVRLGGASAVITVAGATVAALASPGRGRRGDPTAQVAWSGTNPLPNAGASVEPVSGTRPELTPVEDHYRIDINTSPPVVREEEWRLRIGGLVERPGELSLTEIRTGHAPLHQFITLACISNPIAGDLTSTTRWSGVSVREILARAIPRPGATHLRIRSADGFHEVVPLDAVQSDERIMFSYAWDGLPLPIEHGFPLRIYIPDLYGMKQPKWIEQIDLIDHEEEGYWVRRGWDPIARMHATSVIDTVGTDMMVVDAGPGTTIPIGGIAHAGARGVSRVEVRVDEGEWQSAELREPLSPTTWVIWRFEWPFEAGEHSFTVRCFEGEGTPQVAERAPVRPSGATGLHSESVMV